MSIIKKSHIFGSNVYANAFCFSVLQPLQCQSLDLGPKKEVLLGKATSKGDIQPFVFFYATHMEFWQLLIHRKIPTPRRLESHLLQDDLSPLYIKPV